MQRVGKKRFEKEKEREKGKRDEREVQQEEEGGDPFNVSIYPHVV